MSKLTVYPYKPASKSARELSRALGVKRIKHEGSRYKPGRHKTIINWGSSQMPEDLLLSTVLNHPQCVETASNKLSAFIAMTPGVTLPPYTKSREKAIQWLSEGPVVCRTLLQGNSGRGIVIAETEQELVPAPLYVQYIKKKSEWRVHIFDGEVLLVQRKVKGPEAPDDMNWRVRNHANGFIFQQNGINPPMSVITEADAAIRYLGLDFGAVDVIFNEHHNKAYVLEVNCAPGLEGTTLERYCNKIKSVTE